MIQQPDISVVLITYNDEGRIRPCLDSVRWADELVVMDLSSTDQTAQICRAYGARVYTHPWISYADPIRNEACALAAGRWILMLDPDERVTPALAARLREVARREDVDVAVIPLWFMAFGLRRIDPLAMHEALPRFFRAGCLSWPADVHARPDLASVRSEQLDASAGEYLLHDSWQTSDEVLDKINRYTWAEARLMQERGVVFGVGMLVRECSRELGRALIYRNSRNGTMGIISTGFTIMYRFVVWARLWELQGRPRSDDARVRRTGALLGAIPALLLPAYRRFRGRARFVTTRPTPTYAATDLPLVE